MEFIVLLAFLILAWLVWQLINAKKFTQFKQYIDTHLKNQVVECIKEELLSTRCKELPNNDCHQAATIFYWTEYQSRILHAALSREIITQKWLINSGNFRNAQHLFFIERQHLPNKSQLLNNNEEQ